MTVDKNDDVVNMLQTMRHRRKKRAEISVNLKKLIERVDLDRPILAQEKMKYIMLEKKESDDEEEQRPNFNVTSTNFGTTGFQDFDNQSNFKVSN